MAYLVPPGEGRRGQGWPRTQDGGQARCQEAGCFQGGHDQDFHCQDDHRFQRQVIDSREDERSEVDTREGQGFLSSILLTEEEGPFGAPLLNLVDRLRANASGRSASVTAGIYVNPQAQEQRLPLEQTRSVDGYRRGRPFN